MKRFSLFTSVALNLFAFGLTIATPALAIDDSHLHVTPADIEARDRTIAAGEAAKRDRTIGSPTPSPTPAADSRGGSKRGTPTGPGSALPSSSSSEKR